MNQIKKMFEPLTIGSMTLRNRITHLPMGQHRLDHEHYKNYCVAVAKGGCALIPITNEAQYHGDDESIRYLRELADAVHEYGGKIAGHFGTGHGLPGGDEGFSVSEHFIAAMGTVAREATIEEIHQFVRAVGDCARRCQDAGFDAFELHIGMGYTLNRFLSTATNRRTDEYGGSRENRMRLVLEAIADIRSKVAKDFPLMTRFTPDEFMPGGLTWDDWKPMVPILDKAGIDFWSVQPGWHESQTPLTQPSVPPDRFLYLAQELKQIVKTPVLTAYRINDPLVAEKLLVEGGVDLLGLGRQLMADPEFPNKAKEGCFDEIRACDACNFCLGQLGMEEAPAKDRTEPLCCINAHCGMEREYTIQPVTKAKKVFVIGGGPAGMEAAMTAASRGHQVTLYEKGDRLGGQLIIGSVPPYKEDIKRLAHVMATQAKKAGVEIKLNTEVSSQLVLDNKPDAVIIATGAKPAVPSIPGAKGDNVVTALEALADVTKVGNQVVVIGGGLIGCETAEFLAGKGKAVTILEMLAKLATDGYRAGRWVLKQRLEKAGVVLETSLRAVAITPEGVKGMQGRNQMFFPADTVVLAIGFSPNQELFRELQGKLPEIHLVGDCLEPRKIREAIAEGHFVGHNV